MSNLPLVALAVIAALGCGGASTTPVVEKPVVPVAPPAPTGLITINTDSIGPITGKTPANLQALRDLLGKDGYEIRPVNNSGIELHAYFKDELVFYVIPSDDGALFNVHAPSSKVTIAQHPEWRIGSPFTGDEILTNCECWGDNPMCFKKGDHVAVGFVRPGCQADQYTDERLRRVLVGVTIQRAVWSPTAFGFDEPASTVPDWVPTSDPCGGGSSGGGNPCGGP